MRERLSSLEISALIVRLMRLMAETLSAYDDSKSKEDKDIYNIYH